MALTFQNLQFLHSRIFLTSIEINKSKGSNIYVEKIWEIQKNKKKSFKFFKCRIRVFESYFHILCSVLFFINPIDIKKDWILQFQGSSL